MFIFHDYMGGRGQGWVAYLPFRPILLSFVLYMKELSASQKASMGNQWWKLRTKIGREKLFKTPEILWSACVEYFEATGCDLLSNFVH